MLKGIALLSESKAYMVHLTVVPAGISLGIMFPETGSTSLATLLVVSTPA